MPIPSNAVFTPSALSPMTQMPVKPVQFYDSFGGMIYDPGQVPAFVNGVTGIIRIGPTALCPSEGPFVGWYDPGLIIEGTLPPMWVVS